MKKIILIYLLTSLNICFSQTNYHSFIENQEVYLYGNNVKLRELPNTNSKIIKLLPVGAKIKIKKITDKKYDYNGIISPWYLVQSDDIEGYIVGGLISLEKHKSFYYENAFYVFSMSKEKNNDYNNIYINIRFIKDSKISSEIKVNLFGNGYFEILVSDNKGLENAKDIIVIDNYSEACGIDGGKSYIIYNGKKLVHMANTSEIGDGGIYHYNSSFIFPNDEYGKQGVIIYKQENGEMKDEKTNWYITTSQQRDLIWDGKQLIPNDYNKSSEEED